MVFEGKDVPDCLSRHFCLTNDLFSFLSFRSMISFLLMRSSFQHVSEGGAALLCSEVKPGWLGGTDAPILFASDWFRGWHVIFSWPMRRAETSAQRFGHIFLFFFFFKEET